MGQTVKMVWRSFVASFRKAFEDSYRRKVMRQVRESEQRFTDNMKKRTRS